ncbi:TrkH family potassium uptake protein [uncultured Clostridium sp.]|uniref:TrkH family potassium uptake protein n=1 Tax=uncultured Clostridium sp. TaxID=59620 RepID=UPI0025E3B305|nr:TrkH family potassium uptake protein [uncultured Clostridium sp.]
MKTAFLRKKKLSEVRILALGFLIIILLGGVILSLPISSKNGTYTSLVDSIFTATSAVCVTGLITVDTGTHWNTFGHSVIMVLIELGGLGFMSITTFIAVLLGKKITLRDRLIMQEAMNALDIQGLVKMMKYIVILTFSVQSIGAVLLSFVFIPQFGIGKGIFYSIFHSISAFCNAGFDLFGNFTSLTGYYNNYYLIIIISMLIVIGGLGFSVLSDLLNFKHIRKFSIHTKLVLYVTSSLIALGALLIFCVEYKNEATLGSLNFGEKVLNSVFASITPRTAGFNSISTGDMTMSGKLVTIILMFIGGSPGSTAGGLKTTTFAVLILTAVSVLNGRDDTEVFGRRFSKESVYKAFTLFVLAMAIVLGVTMILSVAEPEQQFIDLLYEASSAIGTAGITTGVTQKIGTLSKFVIMLAMYFGRLGPITVFLALMKKNKKAGIRYPEAKILIG